MADDGERPARVEFLVAALCALATVIALGVYAAGPATAGIPPVVTGLSSHSYSYWGGTTLSVHGTGFTHVQKVYFGGVEADDVHVTSATTQTVLEPEHHYGMIHVRVRTSTGLSAPDWASRFTFTHPTMDSPIQGGLTAHQEQRVSSRVRAAHKNVSGAARSSRWTAAMGTSAVSRARSWLGLPYSWAGGSFTGPTLGVCGPDGGDFDCHIVGFDCSGLTLYAWGPYEHLVHFADTQYHHAGAFHPTLGQLTPGDLAFFSDPHSSTIDHVVLYAGNGTVIESPESGSMVRVSSLAGLVNGDDTFRGATRPMSTGRQYAGPVVTSMTSKVAARGGYVTITGRGLSTATSVSLGGTRLYSLRRSAGRVVVKLPAHVADSATVTVSNPWGSASRTVTFIAAPHLTSLTPPTGPVAGGTTVTIRGSYFGTVDRVTVNGTSIPFTRSSTARMSVTVPAHAAGPVPVVVSSPYGTSNVMSYTYVAAPPSTSPPTSVPPNSSTSPATTSPGSSAPPSSGPPPSTSGPASPDAPVSPAPDTCSCNHPGTTAGWGEDPPG